MAKRQVQNILKLAGIQINGSKPWDIQVHNKRLYSRVLSQGSLGLGESYMDGWWDCSRLDQFFTKVLSAELENKVKPLKLLPHYLKSYITNRQTKRRSKQVAEQHYDVGNSFYEDMLDKNMQYTCGYWSNAKTLDQAQIAKMDMVCKKMRLKKGDTILELGGGWGMFARFAAKKYKVHVTSYNIAKEQVDYAKKMNNGLPVKIIHRDYRDARGKFDKVISIGMCEHVGAKNYRTFFKLIHRRLKPGGLAMVHTIGSLKTKLGTDPWIAKYIFPNSMLPSIPQLSNAAEDLFVLEDLHNIGADYDPTLMAWFYNFNKHWPKHRKNYSERFYRMWKYYLLSCAGGFRARKLQLWQVVLSKGGVPGGWKR
jgi:cyclopropane-fatty-acyl-phospholipid synthase